MTDDSGNALVVWEQRVTQGVSPFLSLISNTVWSRRFEVGSGWQAPMQVFTGADWIYGTQAAMDGAGRAIVMALSTATMPYPLLWRRFDPKTGWSAQGILGDPGSSCLAMTSKGDAINVWPVRYGVSPGDWYELWARRYVAGVGWETAPQRVTDAGGDARYGRLVGSRDGTAMLVWQDFDMSRQAFDVRAARFNGFTWESPQAIEPIGGYSAGNTGSGAGPAAAIDSEGNVVTAWTQEDEPFAAQMTIASVWINRYVPGVGWESPVKIDGPSSTTARRPEVALSDDGTLVAVWCEPDSMVTLAPWRVWANCRPPQGQWSGPVALDTGFLGYVNTDGGGNASLLYGDFDGAGSEWSIRALAYSASTGWGQPFEIESSLLGGMSPAVDMSPVGHITVVWQQWTPQGSSIYARRFE